MREATTATASLVDTGSDRRTRVLLAVACVMLAGLIYAVVVRDEAVSCPNELIGAWETSTKEQTINFKNQSHLVWSRKAMQS